MFFQLTGTCKYFPLFQVRSKDVPWRSLSCSSGIMLSVFCAALLALMWSSSTATQWSFYYSMVSFSPCSRAISDRYLFLRVLWHKWFPFTHHACPPSCPVWHRHCQLPSCLVWPAVDAADFPHGWHSSVLSSAAFGMCGVHLFHSGRYAWQSSVHRGTACMEVFRFVWHGPVCVAVLCSPQYDICSSVSFCLAWPPVCSGPLFCPTWHVRRSSVLLSIACVVFFHSAQGSIRGGPLFRPVRHMWWYSILSVGAHFARYGSGLSCAAQCVWQYCRFLIGGLGLFVALPDNPVVNTACVPRSQQWSHYAAKR